MPDTGTTLDHFEALRVPATTSTPATQEAAPSPARLWSKTVDRRNQQSAPLRTQPKRLIICADGTWDSPQRTRGGTSASSNVWRLYQLVSPHDATGTPQLAYYHAGVGTGGFVDRILGGGCGLGIERNIVDCYRFIVDHYLPGDELYLFGFSRGAYTVRSLAGLIRNSGIINPTKTRGQLDQRISEAYALYRSRAPDATPVANRAVDFRFNYSHPDCKITCIGVWDTVGALGIPVGALGKISAYFHGFHDVTLSTWVERAFHAVAVDERRRPFVPTLWEQQFGARERGQVLEQVWFTGVHADVGGGYEERGLADLTLRWMINRVTATCPIELDMPPVALAAPSPIALHDSLSFGYRLLDLFRTPPRRCIDGGLGTTGSRDPLGRRRERLHQSVEYLMQHFATKSMPVLNSPYTPGNVTDYDERRTAECLLQETLASARRSANAQTASVP